MQNPGKSDKFFVKRLLKLIPPSVFDLSHPVVVPDVKIVHVVAGVPLPAVFTSERGGEYDLRRVFLTARVTSGGSSRAVLAAGGSLAA